MPQPCQSCEFREIDFGGCRCQSALLTGEAANTDPACALSPFRERLTGIVDSIQDSGAASFGDESVRIVYRENPR